MIPTTSTTLFVLITVLLRPSSTNAFSAMPLNRALLSYRRKMPDKNDVSIQLYAVPFHARYASSSRSVKTNNCYTDIDDDKINCGATWMTDRVMSSALIPLKYLRNASNLVFKKPHRLRKVKYFIARAACIILLTLICSPMTSFATAIGGVSPQVKPLTRKEMIGAFSLWFVLFTFIALLHAAEVSITTLWPWKVKEFAEEEAEQGLKRGAFKILNKDVTRVLTTILVTSTACSIYTTTIFTQLVGSLFGHRGERFGAIALTAITLFFVELLPKSIGVNNAEQVARLMVPPVNAIATIVGPLGSFLSYLATKTLLMFGLKSQDVGGVTDSELRLIVTGARDSGTIEHTESEMIKGVLNLQDQRVKEIMRPRVEMVAVPRDMSVASVLGVVRDSGYSRIPVFSGEIDNIVGIVIAKSVLDYFVKGVLVKGEYKRGESSSDEEVEQVARISSIGKGNESYVRALTVSELAKRMEQTIADAGLVEPCYFVPDTANGWSVLQEMRKRRVHMAIVVDEYGGTEGLVSLEDIVEEVVGEIYDEDDDEDYEFSEDSIVMQDDGSSFSIRGDADLEDVNTILGLNLDDESLKEFGTLSGYLCMCAGEIPKKDDFIMCRGWCFEVTSADEKRILSLHVEQLIGVKSEDKDEDSGDDEEEIVQEDEEEKSVQRTKLLNNFYDYQDKNRELDRESIDDDSENGTALDDIGTKVKDLAILEDIENSSVNEAEVIERMVRSSANKKFLVDQYKSIDHSTSTQVVQTSSSPK